MTRRLGLLLVTAVSLYAGYSLWRIISTFTPDFSVLYDSASNLWQGESLYRDVQLYTGLGYPPPTLLLFAPFLSFTYPVAQGLWALLSLGALGWTIYLLLRSSRQNASVYQVWLWFALAFLAFPTRFTLGMGQVNLLALLWLVASFAALERGSPAIAGGLLGLTLLLKPHLTLLLPLLVLGRKWKAMAAALVVTVVAVTMVGFIFGWRHYREYWLSLQPLLEFRGREIYYNQGLAAFFSRILPLDSAALATWTSSLMLYVGLLWLVGKRRLSFWKMLALTIPAVLLIEPLSWQHHYVFLLPSFIMLWYEARKARLVRWLLGLSYMLVGVNIKNPQALQGNLVGIMMLSHVFWGNLLLFGLSWYWELAKSSIKARTV